MLSKTCIKCGVELTSENWSKSDRRYSICHCKPCENRRKREWEKKHPKRVKEYRRRWRKAHLEERRNYMKYWRTRHRDFFLKFHRVYEYSRLHELPHPHYKKENWKSSKFPRLVARHANGRFIVWKDVI